MSKLGLVLAGGGGKGAYQLGVWKALENYGVSKNVSAISGTSVGSLNSVLFIQKSILKAEEVWGNISADKILTLNCFKTALSASSKIKNNMVVPINVIKDIIHKSNGIFTREGLVQIIDEHIDMNKITSSDVKIFSACCHITGNHLNPTKARYFELNVLDHRTIKKVLLATSALPVIFEPEEINGEYFIDGGVIDNIPVKPIYEEGCNIIIVVHLSRDKVINHKSFPNCTILEISPTEEQGGLITGTLDFTPEGAKKRIIQGFTDATKIMDPLYKMGLVQAQYMQLLNKIKSDEARLKKDLDNIYKQRELIKDEINRLHKEGNE